MQTKESVNSFRLSSRDMKNFKLVWVFCGGGGVQHMDMVTLIPKLPLSAKSKAIEVSKTRQSELSMADETPSWMERGVASQVSRRR